MIDTKLHIHTVTDPQFMANGVVLHMRDEGPCWLIDPGLPPQTEAMEQYIQDHKLKPEAMILTHAHGDHIAGVGVMLSILGDIPVYLAKEEWEWLTDPDLNLSSLFGFPLMIDVKELRDLKPGITLELDGTQWQVLDTSGHTPGGRSLYCHTEGFAITGDALFPDSIGRTDFPCSSTSSLIGNIKNHLLVLPEETRFLAGHGPESTIGYEKENNPFLQ